MVVQKKISLAFILLVVGLQSLSAQIDKEDNFYIEVSNTGFDKNLVTDYNVDNDFSTDDSVKLQQAINEISSNGGGTLTIGKGNYSFAKILLKSNVHIKIDDEVVIWPSQQNDQKNYNIFSFGSETDPIENVSISSIRGGRYTVDLTKNNNPNVAVFNLNKVSNFLIANCLAEDNYTKFSVVTFGGDFFNGEYLFPKNGVVKDIHNINAHYGYGVVQTQSAQNILFKDLHGLGGATLRMETGFTGLNNLQVVGQPRVGGIDKLVGRNISNKNGNSAVMISPHAMHNGSVDVEGIVSEGAGFAVRIEGGFVSNKYDQTIGLVDGTFQSVRIKDVKATFGNVAEVKSKHFKYYPEEIASPTAKSTYADEIYIGSSIAAVLNHTNYQCKNGELAVIVEEPIEAIGFEYQEPVIPLESVLNDCTSYDNNDNFSIEIIGETCPNENNGILNISAKADENYTLSFNNNDYNFTEELNIENITPGEYLACVTVESEDFEQCFNVKIEEVSEVSGKVSVTSNKSNIEIYNGTKPFKVLVNGIQQFETFLNNFKIDSKKGDLIQVKTSKECEGVLSKTIQFDDLINVYPNPVSSIININSSEEIKELSVYSSVGAVVQYFTNKIGNNKTIDVTSLVSGVYFMKVVLGNEIITKKIIVQ